MRVTATVVVLCLFQSSNALSHEGELSLTTSAVQSKNGVEVALLNRLIAEGWSTLADAKKAVLTERGNVIVKVSLGKPTNQYRVTWLLLLRAKPDVRDVVAFDFRTTSFGPIGVATMLEAVIKRASLLLERGDNEEMPVVVETPVAPEPVRPIVAASTASRPLPEAQPAPIAEPVRVVIAPGVDAQARTAVASPAPVAPASTSSGDAAPASSSTHSPRERKPKPVLAKNSVFAEVAGAAFLYSVNYERILIADVGIRAGVSVIPSGFNSVGWSVPITVTYNGLRSRSHVLELGAGVTIIGYSPIVVSSSVLPVGQFNVGYRYHPVEGAGFHFRVGVAAFVGPGLGFWYNSLGVGVLPWGYLSLGGSF